MQTIIEVQNLRKVYGSVVAVEDVSFDVREGEIFGIIGPNGAGKTTSVESAIGLRAPDGGSVSVLGMDPAGQRNQVSQQIGIQLQQAALPDRLKVWEALDLFSSFYDKTVPWEPLLEEWGLGDKRDAYFGKLSGGQKQRLFIALALLNDPKIVFLDELTTGLDPQARRATWDLVTAIRAQGKTVVLVTHFMDEAEALCDRIAIIDHGRVVALDTPQALIEQVGQSMRVLFTAPAGFDPTTLQAQPNIHDITQQGTRVTVHGDGALLAIVATTLAQQNITPTDLRTERTDLEDVFIALTGRKIRA